MWAELLTGLLARTAQFASGHSAAYNNEAAARRPPLIKRTNRKKSRPERPTLPELDQTNRSVIASHRCNPADPIGMLSMNPMD
jgi:hypothetical protein